jgi:hypothetical protein
MLTTKIKNQLRKKFINPVRKYRLRRIKLIPVQNIIFSENSSEHWQWLKVDGMNVLDLGCGLYDVKDVFESSPIYFKNKNAKKIIGIDRNNKEVDFFNNYFSQTYQDESMFVNKFIDNKRQLSSLITKNQINSIKCDIEGGEIHLFKLKLQRYSLIQHVAIEYHSILLLRELINVNNTEWNFKIINHSIFTSQRNMGVVTLSKLNEIKV